ncbi:MAG: class I mannose-6-phosphate isomerase [Ruminococcus sp.]|nr:class I mannose-6-phosphate isomerase [Candidatus Copronaster equi]
MFYNYPIFFEKNRVYRVYTGGKLFSDFFGDDSTDGNYPEEWVVSTVHALNDGSTDEYEGISKIKDSDIYLSDALKEYKEQIVGDRKGLEVLTKILDSAIRLPVQAHPDKPFSKKYFNSSYGKEESWVILAKRPGAKLFYGFKKGVTMEQFSKAIDESENSKTVMEDLLEWFEPEIGDVVYIPAKMVHAIGAGCLLLEVQEPSDFTVQPERWCGDYRLSDNEMYLGLDKQVSLECFDIDKTYPAPVEPVVLNEDEKIRYESLIDERMTTSFSVRKIKFNGGSFTLDKGACIYVVTEGGGKITGDGYEKEICKGDYFLVPEIIKNQFTITGDKMTVVECYK